MHTIGLFTRLRDQEASLLQKYYADIFSESPSLTEVDERSGGQFSRNVVRVSMRRRRLLASVLLFVVLLLATGAATTLALASKQCLLGALASVAFFATEMAALRWINPRVAHVELVDRLIATVVLIERHADRWEDLNFKARVNRALERRARALERIPKQLRMSDPANRREVALEAAEWASAMRGLKLWVWRPNPFTFTDLLARLTGTLEAVAADRWQELPRAAPTDAGRPRRLALTAAGIAAVALAMAALFVDNVPGPVPVALLAAAVAAFEGSGVSVSSLVGAADAASKVGGKK